MNSCALSCFPLFSSVLFCTTLLYSSPLYFPVRVCTRLLCSVLLCTIPSSLFLSGPVYSILFWSVLLCVKLLSLTLNVEIECQSATIKLRPQMCLLLSVQSMLRISYASNHNRPKIITKHQPYIFYSASSLIMQEKIMRVVMFVLECCFLNTTKSELQKPQFELKTLRI